MSATGKAPGAAGGLVPVAGLVCCIWLCAPVPVHAAYRDDIGYTQLAAELGAALPVGSGVVVAHVEASTGSVDHDGNPDTAPLPVYLPDPAEGQFTGKTITDRTGLASGTWSGHATAIGTSIYGTASSIAPGVTLIDAYLADYWLQDDYLRFGDSHRPRVAAARVANHSWIGDTGNAQADSELLRRLDWVIDTDEFIQVAGSKNSTGANANLLSGAYNVISTGRTDGSHSTGTNAIDADYVAGRARPEIVAPYPSSSGAAAGMSSAVALLVDAGHINPGWSDDPVTVSTTNRDGATVFNAERAEVIKAVLMAGALRSTANSTGADITDYRAIPAWQSANGLDTRFGAGQLNIYNSYRILAAGEQNSDEDDGTGSGAIGVRGFDYDPDFGGAGGSNATASYYFSAAGGVLTATLAWHAEIAGGNGQLFDGTATLHDLDLLLYDVTAAPLLVAGSTSSDGNTETVSFALEPGHDYRLQVAVAVPLQWDYALAWRVEGGDSDGDGVPDVQDNCPQVANASQLDTDQDGAGDACDDDDDNDGTPDAQDAFPLDPTEDTDTDGDGIGNNADDDDDNDGFADSVEVTLGHDPLDPGDAPLWGDLDFDGAVDAVDAMIAARAVAGELAPTQEQLAVGRIAPLVSGVPTPAPGNSIRIPDLMLILGRTTGAISF